MNAVRSCLIAGTHSGCGKTSVALGLMAAFARRELAVQPFKAGPDFIDPGHHALASGRESHNLDGWMLPADAVRDIFHRRSQEADLAVVEGVMGLYDGFSALDEQGSTAQLAKSLNLPVILVVDARSMARSAAALVSGYAGFDPGLNLAGVVFNRVGSDSHADLLREAMTLVPGVEVLGCLPRREDLSIPSRHLGLVTAGEDNPEIYARLADWLENNLDLDLFFDSLPLVDVGLPNVEPALETRVRIGVARDEAFCFYYPENLRSLRLAGAELVEFSPLRDKRLPPDLDGLYLGGGYPELHLFDLAQNVGLKKEITAFSQAGRPVYAECGGFMYLLDSVKGPHGRTFNMAGVFPGRAAMNESRSALGYREVEFKRPCPLGPAGTVARGHEFHYSRLEEDMQGGSDGMDTVYSASGRQGRALGPEGFLIRNTLGSYIHLHFGSNPELASNFIRSCKESAQ